MSDFILDADPIIPTGVPATPVQVAAMVIDPDNPLTVESIPLLVEAQQPSPEDWAVAVEASPLPSDEVIADLAVAGVEVALEPVAEAVPVVEVAVEEVVPE